MSLQQPLYPYPKLLYAILTKKKFSLEQFDPFSIQIENIYADNKQLTRFTHSFGDPDSIPTFAFITAFKASLQCLAQSQTPSSIMGLIHLSSEFQLHNRHNWLMPFNLKVTVSKCEKTSKGLSYQVITDFYQRGKLTITNTNVMLDKAKKFRTEDNQELKTKQAKAIYPKPLATWSINLGTAWSYAKTSGDFNPIHLHGFLAKQFGLKNVLIHGMYNASKTIQELMNKDIAIGKHFVIEFNRPCFIPNDVVLKQYRDSNEYGLFSQDGEDRFLRIESFEH